MHRRLPPLPLPRQRSHWPRSPQPTRPPDTPCKAYLADGHIITASMLSCQFLYIISIILRDEAVGSISSQDNEGEHFPLFHLPHAQRSPALSVFFAARGTCWLGVPALCSNFCSSINFPLFSLFFSSSWVFHLSSFICSSPLYSPPLPLSSPYIFLLGLSMA